MTRALVVDDKEEALYYLRALLEGHGYEVETARHGAEALVKARHAPPAIIVSDLLMPVMDGYTLLRHWKADARLKGIPFVVYTATYTEPEDERLALSLGADAFVLKPCEPDELVARLRAVLAAGRSSGPSSVRAPTAPEGGLLKEYSETLIRKLEEKTLQLEESNQSLHRDIAARERAEIALRESEAKFRLLTEAMPQLVWILNADLGNVFVNQRWVDYTGKDGEASRARGWLAALHEDDRPRVADEWARAREKGDTFSGELRLARADGVYRWWLVRAVPRRDDAGTIVQWFGTCTDIEDLKQAAKQLHETEEQLRQAQKMEAVGRLAGGVAHDFNNLLSVILSYAALSLQVLAPNDPMREDLEEVRRAGERASELTRQLLAFSRQQMREPRVLDLNDVLRDMQKLLRRLVGEEVELYLPTSRSLDKVHADPSQMEQVVMNLAVNARDAMPKGGRLTIETANVVLGDSVAAAHPDVAPGRYVMLAVSDTGTGIDESVRARIFEPFFTTKDTGKGTGLGLATVFGIVKQGQGHVEVASEVGVGTTFKIYLPSTSRAADSPPTMLPAPKPSLGSETILLVEDDEHVRASTRAILQRSGYRVLDAHNAGEAFLISEKHAGEIHALITDMVLPRMSGRELAERILAQRPQMKVLYVSGYPNASPLEASKHAPHRAFLPKPITPETLLGKLRDLLSEA